MEHVEAALDQQPPQGQGPAQIRAGGAPEAVDRHPGGLHGRDQGVLARQDVGDLVVEVRPVPARHHVDEQALGAPQAQALDEEEDPGAGRLGAAERAFSLVARVDGSGGSRGRSVAIAAPCALSWGSGLAEQRTEIGGHRVVNHSRSCLGENVGSGDDSGSGEGGALKVFDVSLVPEDPPDDQLYQHKPDMLHSARELFRRWDVMFTLAERDIRAQYKQAVLGVAWALLVPLVSLFMLVILAGHV